MIGICEEFINSLLIFFLKLTTVFKIFNNSVYCCFEIVFNLTEAIALIIKISFFNGVFTAEKVFRIKLSIYDWFSKIRKIENSRRVVTNDKRADCINISIVC